MFREILFLAEIERKEGMGDGAERGGKRCRTGGGGNGWGG